MFAGLMVFPLFLHGVSEKEDTSPQKVINSPHFQRNPKPLPKPVRISKDAVVRVFALRHLQKEEINVFSGRGEGYITIGHPTERIIGSATGFFVETDRKDKMTLVTVAHLFNTIPSQTKNLEFLVEYKGQRIRLDNAEIAFQPDRDFAVIHFSEKSFPERDSVQTLRLRDIPFSEEGTEELYAMGFIEGDLTTVRTKDIKHHYSRDAFSFIMDKTEVNGMGGAPLLDKEGRVALVFGENFYNYGYGYKAEGLRELIQSPVCDDSLKNCITKAGWGLYQSAKNGNAESQRLLLRIANSCSDCFSQFVGSLNAMKFPATESEFILFEEAAARNNFDIFYSVVDQSSQIQWSDGKKNDQEIQVDFGESEILNKFWEKGLVLQEKWDHPDMQYILCDAWLQSLDPVISNGDEVIRCFMKPAVQGFSQAQWFVGLLWHKGFAGADKHINMSSALEWWKRAALMGHPTACDTLLELYFVTNEGEKCQGEPECPALIRIYHTVKDSCGWGSSLRSAEGRKTGQKRPD